jgi:regulation of enolase protein 1 (concanavalin A-like superfamily)
MKRSRQIAFLPIALAIALAPAIAQEKEQAAFTEPFDGTLAKGWSWVREDSKAWRLDKSVLVVKTSTGGLWQKDNNNRNILLRALPEAKDQRVAVEALVENQPTNAFEHAGLVWYGDDDNYVLLVREKVGARMIVQLVSETKGKVKVGFAESPFEPKTVWLRMELSGGKAKGLFRASAKDEWQVLGQCDLPVKGEPRVGLITGYAAQKSDHEARFSKFRILAAAP